VHVDVDVDVDGFYRRINDYGNATYISLLSPELKPLIPHLPDPTHAWLILAMASTLAGNLTVLGSVANLIVIQRSKHQAAISFWEYFKVGLPLTILSIIAGVFLLG
jgi:Na+/H+ antiporter NhaD/arsenite permease-like protein